ncbi:hypothetical protein Adeg_0808 [Ammonifex degensii KC4]|uniref:Uncharacterized protein n=1 Tax=Ammonifex degensii (strain DSM 10501 / KC4) TaxID=429009 RepID=C9RCH3_AMMDK|nr:hypothetical protein [Ammonifex degensii]ACX51950.1 hypothetical protein Adeg_0808 [Ammonifex degensii KC4]
MSWRAYRLLFRLETPLHVGWRRVGNCWQCRPYLPAYPLLCALAARLTESGLRFGGSSSDPYHNTLGWLREHVRFSYFFPALPEKDGSPPRVTVFLPCYQKGGSLTFRKRVLGAGAPAEGQDPQELPAAEFDYLFMDAQARTALSYPERTARAGALYHFEFLRPCSREHEGFGGPRPVFLTGYFFFDEEAESRLLGDPAPGDERFGFLFDRLQVGGERRLGWGLLRFESEERVGGGTRLFGEPGLEPVLEGGGPRLRVSSSGDPVLLAHGVCPEGAPVKVEGPVEVVLKRKTGFEGNRRVSGRRVEVLGEGENRPLFLPGSRLSPAGSLTVDITPEGLWRFSAGGSGAPGS